MSNADYPMLSMYALEPTIFESCKSAREVIGKFGFSKGRLIVGHPQNWAKQCLGHINKMPPGLNQASAKRILERIINTTGYPKTIVDTNEPYDENTCWLDNAIAIYKKEVIRAIVTKEEEVPYKFCIKLSGPWDEDEIEHKREYQYTKQTLVKHLKKEAKRMVDCIREVLQCAKWIKIIDKHFDPVCMGKSDQYGNPFYGKYESTFRLLMKCIDSGGKAPEGIELYYSGEEEYKKEKIRSFDTVENFKKHMPEGLAVTFYRLSGNMHPRAIITDNALVKFDAGFDDEPHKKNEITMMPEDYEHYLEAYCPQTKIFNNCDNYCIKLTNNGIEKIPWTINCQT